MLICDKNPRYRSFVTDGTDFFNILGHTYVIGHLQQHWELVTLDRRVRKGSFNRGSTQTAIQRTNIQHKHKHFENFDFETTRHVPSPSRSLSLQT